MSRPIKARRTALSTSRHEAAHAVIAEYLGIRVVGLSLSPVAGGVTIGGCELDGRSLRHVGIFAMAMALKAGSVADNYWRSAEVGIVSGGDHERLVEMGANQMDFRALYIAVRPIVASRRGVIERVAHALRESKMGKLSGKRVRELL